MHPIREGDWNLAHLFPDEVIEARQRNGIVILPLAPVEWHGPHLTMGCDGLLAHAFSCRLAKELQCPYYPPLYIGTERERQPEVLQSLGFTGEEYIEGMDFPANGIRSAYLKEDFFSLTVRGIVDALLDRMGYQSVIIVNGHGADNQRHALDRLAAEYNARGRCRLMWFYAGFPRDPVGSSIGHAAAEESSMLAATWPDCVDLARLPLDGALRYIDHAVVDGVAFDGTPTADYTVRERQDPRRHTDPTAGARYIEEGLKNATAAIQAALLACVERHE
jgi:creatinine amidohydrolase